MRPMAVPTRAQLYGWTVTGAVPPYKICRVKGEALIGEWGNAEMQIMSLLGI